MGVNDLLPKVRVSVGAPVSLLEKAAGKRVGIDASCWLHAGAAADAINYVLDGNFSVIGSMFTKRLRGMADAGIEPTVVFDGAPLPGKLRYTKVPKIRADAVALIAQTPTEERRALPRKTFVATVTVSPSASPKQTDPRLKWLRPQRTRRLHEQVSGRARDRNCYRPVTLS